MTLRRTANWRLIALVSLFVPALANLGLTAPVPTDATDLDASPSRRADTPVPPSLWDQPAAPSHVTASPSPMERTGPDRARSDNPLWEIPLPRLATTRDRPIFSPSRRPPPPTVARTPIAAPPPPRPNPVKVERPQFALVGTIDGSEQSFGIFVDQTTKTALRLKVGEDYQGWRLRGVAPGEVTLEHDDQTAVLSLPPPDADAAQLTAVQAENGPNSEQRRLPGAIR
ncbi:hypothetical protein JQ617_14910 [Bradyrhizobium sp. KB893862 SZCCT0404]|uniref:hypothetical protein n=1 Tax=Bradyrhizobium sp. KB893862 SZCCT0404 TaxID=2807672 RepID=UPI001BA89EBA|nr:hypothetical protein [Bradyrhizobium sp. KB893862 SZCCT0404]MBR1175255.1 hypothetical protein [Bradyrhizobium sp. KB893862 SZCCT0404]